MYSEGCMDPGHEIWKVEGGEQGCGFYCTNNAAQTKAQGRPFFTGIAQDPADHDCQYFHDETTPTTHMIHMRWYSWDQYMYCEEAALTNKKKLLFIWIQQIVFKPVYSLGRIFSVMIHNYTRPFC